MNSAEPQEPTRSPALWACLRGFLRTGSYFRRSTRGMKPGSETGTEIGGWNRGPENVAVTSNKEAGLSEWWIQGRWRARRRPLNLVPVLVLALVPILVPELLPKSVPVLGPDLVPKSVPKPVLKSVPKPGLKSVPK